MGVVTDFFDELGFSLDKDLKPEKIYIENAPELNNKINLSTFYYDSPNQTNTSFYFINKALNRDELKEIKKYVWNENKADLLFYLKNDSLTKLVLQYAKVSPKTADSDSILDVFEISDEEQKNIDNIQRWKFDSGIFWTNYQEFLTRSKNFKSIDKELVSTLEALKNQLNDVLTLFLGDEEKKEEYVQALIDRTLYIKYLEDNHIINSYFYEHHFKDSETDYKKLLYNADSSGLNKLFEIIHDIFNNELFEKPTIPEKYLNTTICSLIHDSLNHNIEVGQLRLFDFRFDIIPVEFISYIYEIFLTDKQKENGIFYTPKKLAQLIVDDVIPENEIGSVLDPSCGSGMFLITAFQRLLENSNEDTLTDIATRIEFRTKLLEDNIFGIEKQITAQRFTLFSLSLQLFRGLEKTQIRDFIANQLKEKGQVELFKKHRFFKNIQHANSLEVDADKIPHANKTFSYIVGNPPFFEVKNTTEFKTEINFINNFSYDNSLTKFRAKDVIGKHQISQCFFLKIKDWSNINTKFGFVSNSSNFYFNDKSLKFQDFFYSEYNIQKIYELSKVKNILFENTKESVISLIFSNLKKEFNFIKYYPVGNGLFSKKPFKLLIIKEETSIKINQTDLISHNVALRDFLIGNEYDISIIKKLSGLTILELLLDKKKQFSSFRGLTRIDNKTLLKYFNINRKLNRVELSELHLKYSYEKYLNKNKTNYYTTPYLYKPENKLKPFKIDENDGYVNPKDINDDNFQRTRNSYIYEGNKILINKFGEKLQAAPIKEDLFFSNLIYSIKLDENKYLPLITALINSDVINYFIILKYRSRIGDNFTNINTSSIKNIPIPKDLESNTAIKISKLSNDITNGLVDYSEVKNELNELVFDLYELSYLERQRIKDYFIEKKTISVSENEIGDYIDTLNTSIEIFLKNSVSFETEHNKGIGLVAIKVNLNGSSNTPSAKKTGLYLLNEIFEQNPQENFLASREKIWGKDCVYIIKQDLNINWSKTKAYEDGQEVLKKLMR